MSRLLLIVALVAVCTTVPLAGAQSGESEPNDLIRQATGPLAGGVDVAGRLTGSTDRDWFLFYARGDADFTVTVTNTSTSDGCRFVQVALLDSDAEAIESFGMEAGDVRTIERTPAGYERYYLRVDGDGCKAGTPASYTLRIDPSAALTATPPSGLKPPACQDARDRLTVAQKALRRARGARKKRAAKRKVTAARRAVAKSC